MLKLHTILLLSVVVVGGAGGGGRGGSGLYVGTLTSCPTPSHSPRPPHSSYVYLY